MHFSKWCQTRADKTQENLKTFCTICITLLFCTFLCRQVLLHDFNFRRIRLNLKSKWVGMIAIKTQKLIWGDFLSVVFPAIAVVVSLTSVSGVKRGLIKHKKTLKKFCTICITLLFCTFLCRQVLLHDFNFRRIRLNLKSKWVGMIAIKTQKLIWGDFLSVVFPAIAVVVSLTPYLHIWHLAPTAPIVIA